MRDTLIYYSAKLWSKYASEVIAATVRVHVGIGSQSTERFHCRRGGSGKILDATCHRCGPVLITLY